MAPQAPGERSLSYKNCPLFTHSICYWGACIHFRVGGDFLLGFFLRRSFPWGGKFPGIELVRGNYTPREFVRILTQNSFYMSYFHLSVSILGTEWLRVIVRVKFQRNRISRLYIHGEGVSP